MSTLSTIRLSSNLVQSVIEGANTTFYENNQDTANDYFSGPHYPQSAVDALGYPAEIVGNRGGNGTVQLQPSRR